MCNVIKPYFVNQVCVSGTSSVFLHSSPFIFLQEKCDPSLDPLPMPLKPARTSLT